MTRPAPVADLLSLVIPVFNEKESLPLLREEIDTATRELGWKIEILFVDDGSNDGSWEVIHKLAEQDRRVQGVRFRRNFGKAAALSAGFERASGAVVMTLDADLQDDPHEIPQFLAAIQSGADVVSGWKKVRYDPWHKVFPSRVFNAMVSKLTGVKLHDHNCGFKAYRAEVTREVRLYGELHRFVPVLAAAQGFRVNELVIHHRARKFGRSKFGARRFLKGFLDLLAVSFRTQFGYRPMHAFGTVTVLLILLGLLLDIVTMLLPIGIGSRLLGNGSLLAYLFAGQSLLMGFLAEHVLAHSTQVEPYRVLETTTTETPQS
jgi:glycosyltransferase involved in cell wall biosynthesis